MSGLRLEDLPEDVIIEIQRQLSQRVQDVMRKIEKEATTKKLQQNKNSENMQIANFDQSIFKSKIHVAREKNFQRKVKFNCQFPTHNPNVNFMHYLLHENHICINNSITNKYNEISDSDDEFERIQNENSPLNDKNLKKGKFIYSDFDESLKYQTNLRQQREISVKKEMNRIIKQRRNIIENYDSNKIVYYKLYIEMTNIEPKIYRNILVLNNISLAVFHDKILSILFNWHRNYHGYQFRIPHCKNKNISYGCVDANSIDMGHCSNYQHIKCGSHMIDSRFVYLCDVLKNVNDKLRYIYDLGDQYHHTITLKKIITITMNHSGNNNNNNYKIVKILNGKRNSPPEDTDGNAGYVETLNKISLLCNTINSDSMYQSKKEEFFTLMARFANAFNINGTKFDSEEFNIKKMKKLLYLAFQTGLSSQSDANMYDYKHHCCMSEVPDHDRGWLLTRRCYYVKCRKIARKMKVCKRCKSAYYCNKLCQKKDWKTHHRYYCFNRILAC